MPVSLSSSIDELRSASPAFEVTAEAPKPERTGRYIVTFHPAASAETSKMLADSAGLRVAHATDFTESAVSFDSLGGADALVLPEVGIAVVSAEPEQMEKFGVETATGAGVMAIEPECFAYALATAALGPRDADETGAPRPGNAIDLSPEAASYLREYRDALTHLTDSLLGAASASAEAAAPQPAAALNETAFTWGLQATRAQLSSFTGRGSRCSPRYRIRFEPSGFPFAR